MSYFKKQKRAIKLLSETFEELESKREPIKVWCESCKGKGKIEVYDTGTEKRFSVPCLSCNSQGYTLLK